MPPDSDWSQLPADLLLIISKKITAVPDYLLFRSVCSHWRSATPRYPLLAPWLMLPAPPTDSFDHKPRRFYDLSNGKSFELDLARFMAPWARFGGSSRGWLVLQEPVTTAVSLINPATGDKIRLPPVTKRLNRLCLPPFEGDGREHVLQGPFPFAANHDIHQRYGMVRRAALSWAPPFSSDCVVMASIELLGQVFLAFCKVGGTGWTKLEGEGIRRIVDLTYHRGRFCTVSQCGKVTFWEVGPPWKAVMYSTKLPRRGNLCLVENSSRDVLMVAWDSKTGRDGMEYNVLKLSFDGQPRWQEVKSIGDSMIFLGGHNQCLALSASKFGASIWRRNRIYCTYPCFDACKNGDGHRLKSHDIRSYSIGGGSFLQIKSCLGLFFSEWLRCIWSLC